MSIPLLSGALGLSVTGPVDGAGVGPGGGGPGAKDTDIDAVDAVTAGNALEYLLNMFAIAVSVVL